MSYYPFFGAESAFDDVNERLGIGDTTPDAELDIVGSVSNSDGRHTAIIQDGASNGTDGGLLISSFQPRLVLNDESGSQGFHDMRVNGTTLSFGYGANSDLFTRTGNDYIRIYSDGSLVVGSPGGTPINKGAGTINAVTIYDDGVDVTCYVLEAENTGNIDMTRWPDQAVKDEEDPQNIRNIEDESHSLFIDQEEGFGQGSGYSKQEPFSSEEDKLYKMDEVPEPIGPHNMTNSAPSTQKRLKNNDVYNLVSRNAPLSYVRNI